MSERRKPDSQRDTIDQLYYGLYGVNGSPGLIDRVSAIESELGSIDVRLNDHVATKNGHGEKKPKRLEVLTIVLSVTIGLQSLGLLDAIRAVIWQALTGQPVPSPPGIEQSMSAEQIAQERGER